MARILFTWELGGGLGHVAPLVPLLKRLKALGHDLVAATRKSPAAQRLLDQNAVRCLAAPFLERPVADAIEPARTFSHVLYNTGFHNRDVLLDLAQRWRQLLAEVQPDLVVCEHSPIAMLALRATRLPHAAIGMGFCCPPASAFTHPFLEWPADTPQKLQLQEEVVRENANAVLSALNGARLAQLSDLFEQAPAQLLLTYFEMDHFPDRVQAEYFGVPIPTLGTSASWPETKFPRVFVYVREFDHIEGLLRFLRVSQLTCVVSSDELPPAVRKAYATDHLRFLVGPCDTQSGVGMSDLVITHGNHGMTSTALLLGKPVLTIPLVMEQFLLSRRVAQTGASRMAEPQQLDSIVGNLRLMLQNESYAQAAQQLQERYTLDQADVVDRVTESIVALLSA
jgi:UDP-N-acetylglucosamine:LPS N-acetylglucosamine transferase